MYKRSRLLKAYYLEKNPFQQTIVVAEGTNKAGRPKRL
jgi:hypothetical protein